MQNEYLPTTPFDLYELHLLRLVAKHGSFTSAARDAGVTQSAITRQVQGVEERLGVRLFERTTRRVALTKAGSFLFQESGRIVGGLDALLRRLREDFTEAPKEVRVGVAGTISIAYLPGFFAAQRRRQPEVRLRVTHGSEAALLPSLEANELDVAILSAPRRLPPSLQAAHRFQDAFDLILPADWTPPASEPRQKAARWKEWLSGQPWLLMHAGSATGHRLQAWVKRRGWWSADTTELDSFDLIINLVALGQGAALVPQRALAIYSRQRKYLRFAVPERFTREIVVLTRRRALLPSHVGHFVENILF